MQPGKRGAQEFIQGVFAPMITAQCSPDAEDVCRRNNLSFVELLQPFCQAVEVTVRPPNTIQGSIATKLRLCVRDLNNPLPQLAAAKKLLNDSVANVQPSLGESGASLSSIKAGCYNLQVSSSTPWFQSYRDTFFRVMPPLEHDFTRHFLACMFVISSGHAAPQEELQRLVQAQQQCQANGTHHSRWFYPQTLKYYVLIHDALLGNQAKAEATFQGMKKLYGASCCHLLQVNSAPADDPTVSSLPDLWSQFLHAESCDKQAVNDTSSKTLGSNLSLDDDIFQQELGNSDDETRNHCAVQHPLLSSGDSSSPTLDVAASEDSVWRKPGSRLGRCLSQSDRERVRVFVQEFCSQGLVPYIEEQMRILNDQVTNKKGIHRSFMSMKKLFAGSKTIPQGPHSSVNSVVYGQDAPELQVRRLGDLAFLFQLYEFAYQAYHSAKRDFSSDSAWLHFAGAQEMAALAVFMAGVNAQRPFPLRYMDSAIDLYLNTCKLPQLATRAALLSTECLRHLGQHSSVAAQLIRLTSEDSDLRSALLLEQAAYCFLQAGTAPSVRKYAFHVVLAGHRYSKAGHRKHSLRAYQEALQVYQGRNWSLAEDHIHFTIGRQSTYLKLVQGAHEAFHCLLAKHSEQSPTQQLLFLREYLLVLKMLHENDLAAATVLLPVPEVHTSSTRVYLGPVADEGALWGDLGTWLKLEECAATVANDGTLPATFRPQLSLLSDDTDNGARPLTVVGEPVTVELELRNPLQIALQLSQVHLLWSFLPSDREDLISNDKADAQDGQAATLINTGMLDEVLLESEQKQRVRLTLVPHCTGDLHVTGFAYRVGLSPTQLDATSDLGPLPSPVRGRQLLSVRGPKLKNLKVAKNGQFYSPDWRLHPTVVAAMPQLTVSFSNVPRQLLCGEAQRAVLHVSNAPNLPELSSLLIASPTPQLFCLGFNDPDDEGALGSADEGIAYREKPLQSSRAAPVLAQRPTANFVCSLPEAVCRIPGGGDASVPLWIRGPDVVGRHTLRLLFYYESAQKSSRLTHRVLYHNIHFSTLPSLALQASARQSVSAVGAGSPNGLLVSLQAKNLSEAESIGGVDLSLLQVTCVSRVWNLIPLTTHLRIGASVVKPQETKNLVFKAVPFSSKLSQDNTAVVSQLPLARVQVESTCTPCLDFCWRGSQEWPPLSQEKASSQGDNVAMQLAAANLEKAPSLDITLAILWKAAIERDGQIKVVMGQQHVTLKDFHTLFSSVPGQKMDLRPAIPVYPTMGLAAPTFQYVRCALVHPVQANHDFMSSRILVIPVSLVVHNSSFRTVTVSIEPAVRTPPAVVLSSPVTTPELVATDVGGFSWVTGIRRHYPMKSRETVTFPLTAAFSMAGTYNVAALEVSVLTDDGRLSHEPLCPSLVVVQQHRAP